MFAETELFAYWKLFTDTLNNTLLWTSGLLKIYQSLQQITAAIQIYRRNLFWKC